MSTKLVAVVRDSPASLDVRCTIDYNGNADCNKCVAVGWCIGGKMTIRKGEYTLGIDDSFRQQIQSFCHQGHSNFETLSIDMILTFTLGQVHMICLSLIEKLIRPWIKLSNKRLCNVDKYVVWDINKLISSCIPSTPSNFQRKCWILDFISVWKATECRLFLLYLGSVILQKCLPQTFCDTFKSLVLAMYSLARPRLHKSATESVITYLLNFLKGYGQKNLFYNVHLLKHLPDDVSSQWDLDYCSDIPLESHMRQIKKQWYFSVHALDDFSRKIIHFSEFSESL